jgi:nitrogen-specific signal transduction histidine kinase
MAYQLTPFMFLYATIFAFSGLLAVYSTRRYLRQDRRLPVLAFAILLSSVAFWELLNFLRELVASADLKLILNNILNSVAVPFLLFSLLFFALAFSENRRWIPWIPAALLINVAAVGVLLALSPEFLYESRGVVTRGPVTILGLTFEEYVLHDRVLKRSFRLYSLYTYLFPLVSAGILIRYISARSDELRTEHSLLIGVGIGTPLVLNTTILFGVLPPNLNFTDLGFGVTAGCFAVAIFRYQLFELPPIGRQQLIGVIGDPLVIVDDESEVVYSNTAARAMFAVESGWRGMDAAEFFGPHAEQIRPGADTSTHEDTIELGDADRYFDIRRTEIQTPARNTGGWVIVFSDVTELKRTNRRLDRFASMVSHDLRTPLNRATARLGRLSREQSDEGVEAVRTELARMESIIDDMLQLARAGEAVDTTEACSLGDLVTEVWETLETDDAELECHVGDTTVEADLARLFQVFENLLGNALVHNDTPLTVRVGRLDVDRDLAAGDALGGFFVEDDGRGIPGDEREEIFEYGYTTDEVGNGYGLSIVRQIVEAHGWELHATEGSDGGARFAITGVEIA